MTAEGHFVEGLLTGGNVHDVTVADELFADVVGFYVVEDAGYDSDPHRRQLRSIVIPNKNYTFLLNYLYP